MSLTNNIVHLGNISDMDETPNEQALRDQYKIPTPLGDDHRRPSLRHSEEQTLNPQHYRPQPPELELQTPTPGGSTIGPNDLLHIDAVLAEKKQKRRANYAPDASPANISITRDFENENAVSDVSDDGGDAQRVGRRRGSAARRNTRRGGRPRDFLGDISRDSSSTRSSSPANSIEAFAEGRKRPRANTVGSVASSDDFPKAHTRTGSYRGSRRPTLDSINVPLALRSRIATEDEELRNANFAIEDEPGKTYRIDFEELEEFATLCKQGKYPVEGTTKTANDKVREFQDLRRGAVQEGTPEVALGGEIFIEKPIESSESATASSDSTKSPELKPNIDPAQDRYTFFSSDVITPKRVKSLADFTDDGTKFQELFDVGAEGGVWWLDISCPTRAELDVISSAFKIHRLTKEDIETRETREKVELFRDYYFVSFQTFNQNKLSEDFLEPIHLYIIVTQDGVLTFSYNTNPHADNVRRRITKFNDFDSLGPDYICYAMIDNIVDSYQPIIKEVEIESETIEDSVFTARDEDFSSLLRQIGEARKRVMIMMRLLGGKADVIKGFAKRCNEQFEITPRIDIGLYLSDIQDHVITMMSNLGHVEKMLSRSHANYLAQLNVDHLLRGNSTNKSLARVTVLATILVPMNLITGLFGMNVHVPGGGAQGESPSLAWFGGILGFIGTFCILCLIIARRARFI